MADGKSGWGSVLPNVAWVTAAVGAPTAAVGVLHGFVARHPVWAVVLVVGYEIVLGAVRFAGRIVAVWAARAQDEIAAGGWVRLRSWVSRFGRRYRRWLLAGLEQVDLRGLGTVADTAPLLDRVYVDVRLVRRPQHEIARAQLFSDTIPAQRPDRLSLFDLLGAAGSTVAVLGAPGSGKTTLVRHAARMAYRKRFGRNTVPVLLYLREHSAQIAEQPDVSLPELAAAKVPAQLQPPAGWFGQRLLRGECVVLFDGLDEVADPDQRATVTTWIGAQIDAYSTNRFVVTSRPHGYEPAAINQATVVQVRQLTDAQVSDFVVRWYEAVGDSDGRARTLLDQITDNPALRAMAVNPLLLTMMVNVHRDQATLPDTRIQLYHEIFSVLLWRRQKVKGVAPLLSGDRKLEIVQLLALAMMRKQLVEITETAAAAVVRGRLSRFRDAPTAMELLAELRRDGVLISPASGSIAFAHLTFQEFLAGTQIHRENAAAVLVANVDDAWWHQTTVLYASRFDADAVIEACLAAETVTSLSLAFDCVEHDAQLRPELRAEVEALLGAVTAPNTDPAHRRLLTQVWVSRYVSRTVDTAAGAKCTLPVTGPLYRIFQHQNGNSHPPDSGTSAAGGIVRGVRAEDAMAFLSWVNEHMGETRARLPEAVEVADLAERGMLGAPSPAVWLAPRQARVARWASEGIDHPCDVTLAVVREQLKSSFPQLLSVLTESGAVFADDRAPRLADALRGCAAADGIDWSRVDDVEDSAAIRARTDGAGHRVADRALSPLAHAVDAAVSGSLRARKRDRYLVMKADFADDLLVAAGMDFAPGVLVVGGYLPEDLVSGFELFDTAEWSHAAAELAAATACVLRPALRRELALTAAQADLALIAVLSLAAEAHRNGFGSVAEFCRQLALRVVVQRGRLFGPQLPDEVIVLALVE